jgi:hypothetical protein
MTSERDSTMTLEQVRDWHREYAKTAVRGTALLDIERFTLHEDMADTIDVHLAARDAVVSSGIPVPVSIDRTHKNLAYVTLGFADASFCTDFIKAAGRGFKSSLASRKVAVPDAMEVRDIRDPFFTGSTTDAYANGWNACRQAMLASQDEVK